MRHLPEWQMIPAPERHVESEKSAAGLLWMSERKTQLCDTNNNLKLWHVPLTFNTWKPSRSVGELSLTALGAEVTSMSSSDGVSATLVAAVTAAEVAAGADEIREVSIGDDVGACCDSCGDIAGDSGSPCGCCRLVTARPTAIASMKRLDRNARSKWSRATYFVRRRVSFRNNV